MGAACGLERVGLSEWANRLPKGLATELGERGMRVSGGEPALAVARALLADFPVLVLDEPTEHLDTATADAITADLLAITAGRSTLSSPTGSWDSRRWTASTSSMPDWSSNRARTTSSSRPVAATPSCGGANCAPARTCDSKEPRPADGR